MLAALAGLLVFVGMQGSVLLDEYRSLRAEESQVRATTVVGYPGITPEFSYARAPRNWFHDEGDSTLLWGGWRDGAGHTWFRVGRGEVDRSRVSYPVGKDAIRAIDYPVVEQGGGRLWGRIPDEAPVVGMRIAGVDTVYPVIVLEKVLVVNDLVNGRPSLVLTSPFETEPEARTVVYHPVVDGRRLTMGLTGYFHDRKPLLYDRGTQSLWVGDPDALRAIAGPQKGRVLPGVARLTPVAWGDWRSEHPGSRLVVGADRTRPGPVQ